MDPTATLDDILYVLFKLNQDNDPHFRETAVEQLRNLANWLEKGGFAPKLSRGGNEYIVGRM